MAVLTLKLEEICRYQHGLPQDMLPFTCLPRRVHPAHILLRFVHETIENQPKIDAVLTPWLASYGLSRIPHLVTSLSHTATLLLEYGAYHGRLDILQDAQVDGLRRSPNLLVLCALQGDADTIKYLFNQGYILGMLDAGRAAAWKGSLVVLACLAAIDPKDYWIRESTLLFAAMGGHLPVLQWLVRTWPSTNTAFRSQVEKKCLEEAVRHQHHDVAYWLAQLMQTDNQAAIVAAFHLDASVDVLVPFVDDLLGVVNRVVRSTPRVQDIHTLDCIFQTMEDRQYNTRVIAEAKKAAMLRAVCCYRFEILAALERTMEATDVQAALTLFVRSSIDRSFVRDLLGSRCDSLGTFMLFFSRHGTSFAPIIVKAVVRAVGYSALTKYLVHGCASDISQETTEWLEEIVGTVGGDGAFTGHLLLQMAQTRLGKHAFQMVYKSWLPQATADEKERVQVACLKLSQVSKYAVVLSGPHNVAMLNRVARYSSVDVVRTVLSSVTAGMSPSEAQEAESRALLEATMAQNKRVVEWLVHLHVTRRTRQHIAAIKRAVDVAAQGTDGRLHDVIRRGYYRLAMREDIHESLTT
ncbi:Aste57867_1776 [Aphanomyces stellatus]|uniref:Aste57867_1776 protein n=1 Tax=Aphanomyces stellatus TaxID=120398 RepID=A0A485K778_9STRA|nr:hypothetical protein As57867_001774 [Aphanomyces stellatus]VFT78985.1 Aste57867_1776 [Aphanomyces stellatus]